MSEIGTVIPKAWGKEVVLVNGPQYCSKKLIVEPGHRCSLHRHARKNEAFICESGYGWVLLDNEPIELTPGAVVEVPAGTWHMFWCPGGRENDPPLVLLEVSEHHSDDDVERWLLMNSAPLHVAPRVPMEELEVRR